MKSNTRAIRTTLLTLFALIGTLIPGVNYAGTPAKPHAAVPAGATSDATTACSDLFTTTTNNEDYLQYCSSVNGNIVEFQSPLFVESIADGGNTGEGYGICDTATGIAYYDWASSDSGNWNAAKILVSTGTTYKIQRVTSDGAWTLTQTIQQVAGPNPSAKITMQLEKSGGETGGAYLVRWANVNAGSAYNNSLDNFDATANGAWGYVPVGTSQPNAYGLQLQNLGATSYVHYGVPLPSNAPPNVCSIAGLPTAAVSATDGSMLLWYIIPSLAHGKSATVTVTYAPF